MHQRGGLKSNIKSLAELKQIVLELKEQGKRIVFTNGCFDLFHVGHASGVREAKKLGDVLIVAVNSDRSVRALKGHKRPLIAQEQRLELVASLESVDYAVMFHELDPLKIIEEIEPHVLAKGGDWNSDDIVGREVVEKAGGAVISIPLVAGVSTTHIINRVLEVFS